MHALLPPPFHLFSPSLPSLPLPSPLICLAHIRLASISYFSSFFLEIAHRSVEKYISKNNCGILKEIFFGKPLIIVSHSPSHLKYYDFFQFRINLERILVLLNGKLSDSRSMAFPHTTFRRGMISFRTFD